MKKIIILIVVIITGFAADAQRRPIIKIGGHPRLHRLPPPPHLPPPPIAGTRPSFHRTHRRVYRHRYVQHQPVRRVYKHRR